MTSCTFSSYHQGYYSIKDVSRINDTFEYLSQTIGISGHVLIGSTHDIVITFSSLEEAINWNKQIKEEYKGLNVFIGKGDDPLNKECYSFSIPLNLWHILLCISQKKIWYKYKHSKWCEDDPLNKDLHSLLSSFLGEFNL